MGYLKARNGTSFTRMTHMPACMIADSKKFVLYNFIIDCNIIMYEKVIINMIMFWKKFKFLLETIGQAMNFIYDF